MNDIKLIKTAAETSEVISSIDYAWRRYIDSIEHDTIVLPFNGVYNAIIRNGCILIEGYSGPLFINKVCSDTTYVLKEPVICNNFKLYGVYDKNKNFDFFTSIPQIGVHYMSIDLDIELCPLCTGDLVYQAPQSFSALQQCCSEIIKLLKVIYLGSLGTTIILPKKKHFALRKILADRSISPTAKLNSLKEKRLINNPIL